MEKEIKLKNLILLLLIKNNKILNYPENLV